MKYLVEVDGSGMILDKNGNSTGLIAPIDAFDKASDKGDIALQLVKQGVTVDEIIKLKNADLL